MYIRCIIKKVRKNYYIGVDFNNKRFKISRNGTLKNLKVGTDVDFYFKTEKRTFRDIIIPISFEEMCELEKTSEVISAV